MFKGIRLGVLAAGYTLALGAPAFAQAVGGAFAGGPQAILTAIATAGLACGGALMTLAGLKKAIEVWIGHRDMYDGGGKLIGGGILAFGTAAAIGF